MYQTGQYRTCLSQVVSLDWNTLLNSNSINEYEPILECEKHDNQELIMVMLTNQKKKKTTKVNFVHKNSTFIHQNVDTKVAFGTFGNRNQKL